MDNKTLKQKLNSSLRFMAFEALGFSFDDVIDIFHCANDDYSPEYY